jgi:hypothetical protein
LKNIFEMRISLITVIAFSLTRLETSRRSFLSPGDETPFRERLEPSPVGQPLVITKRRDAERAKSGTPCDRVPERLAVEQSGKEPCAERVSCTHGINFRDRVARTKTAFRTVRVPGAFVASLQDDLGRSQ